MCRVKCEHDSILMRVYVYFNNEQNQSISGRDRLHSDGSAVVWSVASSCAAGCANVQRRNIQD